MKELIKQIARETLRSELHVVRFLADRLPDGVADIIKIPRHEDINAQINWLQKVAEESLQITRNQPNLTQLRDIVADTIEKDGTPLDNIGNIADGYKIGDQYIWFRHTFDDSNPDENKPWEMTNKGFTIILSDDCDSHVDGDSFDGHEFTSFTPKGHIKTMRVNETTPIGIFQGYEPRTLRTALINEGSEQNTNLESWSEVIESIRNFDPKFKNILQK